MKRLIVILSLTTLLPATTPAQTWTGATSAQWDLAANWNGGLPAGGTAQAAVEGWGAGYTNAQPAFGWPVVDSSVNTYWGVSRFRGPGLHFTQTGGTNEWSNGSGRSSKGITLQSRPPSYPDSVGSPNNPAHPCLMKITGGTHITDAIGLGVPGGLNSGTLQSTPPNGGGDFAEDTANYRRLPRAVAIDLALYDAAGEVHHFATSVDLPLADARPPRGASGGPASDAATDPTRRGSSTERPDSPARSSAPGLGAARPQGRNP